MTGEPVDEAVARLRWQCRRGLLELDLLFDTFLDHGYAQLAEEQRQQFRLLLEEPDPVLNAWFTGQEPATTPAFAELVEQIRRCVAKQSSPQV